MDTETTTRPGRRRAVARSLLWLVVVPIAVGIGVSEGRIRLRTEQTSLTRESSTTFVPAAPPTTVFTPIAPGTLPVTTSTSAVARPPAVAGAIARNVVWYQLADCESGAWTAGSPIPGSARWDILARGYQGGLQFHPITWDRFRKGAEPHEANLATSAEQIVVAERVLAREGVNAWPTCGPRIGLDRLLAPGHTPLNSSDLISAAEPTVLDDE